MYPDYFIIAYPNGVATTVAWLPSRTLHGEASLEGVIDRAKVHARLRGEYVDIIRDDERLMGTCDGAGIVCGYEGGFRHG